MRRRSLKNKSNRAQAVVEFAIFGALILMLFGVLLSNLQRLGDRQYVEMETFRRALQRACTYQGASSGGAGASVQFNLIQNRRLVDLGDNFRKGSPSTASAGSSVMWAVPKVGSSPVDLLVYRINEDQREWNRASDGPFGAAGENSSVRSEDLITDSNLDFHEVTQKQENAQAITNISRSRLKETIVTTIPYTLRRKDDDDDDDNDAVIGSGDLWRVEQHLYRDTDGQYKYSTLAPEDTVVESEKTWVTQFTE